MKGLSYVRSRGTTARGGLVFRHADDHGPGGEAFGLSDQAVVPGTLAGKGSWVCRPYGETHHPAGDGTKAIEPVPGGMRGSGPPNGSARSATGSGAFASKFFLSKFLHYFFRSMGCRVFQQELHHMTARTRTGTGPPCLYIPET